jgi:hypothetical protein
MSPNTFLMRFFAPVLLIVGRALVAIAYPAWLFVAFFRIAAKIQPGLSVSGVIRPSTATQKSAGRDCPIRTVSVL